MSNELSKPVQLPAFMQDDVGLGSEELDRYIQPPRLKIVQKMSKPPIDQWEVGTTLLVPQLVEFAEVNKANRKGIPFSFVPLFFYAEWIQTNPLGKTPFVRDRSLDPRSELAKKAKNRETWFEKHPEDPEAEVANRECLNFVVMPYNHQYAGTMAIMTFSKATYRDGSNLASMVKLRKAPMFGIVFSATTGERSNEKGVWYGFDISPNANPPFVTQEEYEMFKELHLKLKSSHEEGLLQVDYDDVPEGEAESSEF